MADLQHHAFTGRTPCRDSRSGCPSRPGLGAVAPVLDDVTAEIGEGQQEYAVELPRLAQMTGEGAQTAPELCEEDPVLCELIARWSWREAWASPLATC